MSAGINYINFVPQEIMEDVFSHFDLRNIGNNALVCKEWQTLVDRPWMWGGEKNRKIKIIRKVQSILQDLIQQREKLKNMPFKDAWKEWHHINLPIDQFENTIFLSILSITSAMMSGISFIPFYNVNFEHFELGFVTTISGIGSCILGRYAYMNMYAEVGHVIKNKITVLDSKIKKWTECLKKLCNPTRP